jgi:hypothetical protein
VTLGLAVARTLPDVGRKNCRGDALKGVMANPLERVDRE